ncbi:MAG TPA: TRAP transporter substrate-binding protein DctP [Burkholderiales bacterium]|nr:TRAP transporter substrate-binding protein DctP [Burkholderiales bacterium]
MHRIIVLLIALALASPVLAQQKQNWKMANVVPEGSWFGKQHKWWVAEAEKRSGDQIKVQIFWLEQLAKWKDALPAIQSGVADLAWVSSTYFPSQFPGYLMLDNMFNFGDDYAAAVLALIDTVENEPVLKAELAKADIILLMPHISGHAPVGTKTQLKSIKDLKGKSLRTYGGVRTDFYKNLGGNPIFMSFSEMYEAMNRGTVDALGDMAIVLSNAFKLQEVAKFVYTNAPGGVHGNGGALASGFYMSQKKFNALPKDQQKMLMDLRREYGIRYAQTLMDDESAIRKEWETKHNVKFYDPTPEDAKFIQQAGNTANEEMFKKQEADGHKNVRQVWAYYLKARQKHEGERKKK